MHRSWNAAATASPPAMSKDRTAREPRGGGGRSPAFTQCAMARFAQELTFADAEVARDSAFNSNQRVERRTPEGEGGHDGPCRSEPEAPAAQLSELASGCRPRGLDRQRPLSGAPLPAPAERGGGRRSPEAERGGDVHPRQVAFRDRPRGHPEGDRLRGRPGSCAPWTRSARTRAAPCSSSRATRCSGARATTASSTWTGASSPARHLAR